MFYYSVTALLLQFVDDDKCCVIVTCAGNAELDDEESPCHGIEVKFQTP